MPAKAKAPAKQKVRAARAEPGAAAPASVAKQAVSTVRWVHRSTLKANAYNPNKVFPPELKLLKQSLLRDGWTLPLIVRSDSEIIDGYHRWLLSDDPDVYTMTDGWVPVVTLRDRDLTRAHQVASTIRYNRARGVHGVVKMAEIVSEMKDKQHMTDAEIALEFGMEAEEIMRLYQHGNMLERVGKSGFDKAWVPGDDPATAHDHAP